MGFYFLTILFLMFFYLFWNLIEFYAFAAFFLIIIYVYRKLSYRILQCERALGELKTRIDESSQFDQNALPQQVCESLSTSTPPLKTHDQSTATQVAAISATNAITQLSQLKNWKRLKCSFEIPKVIKENWMGVFGSIALVIGAVFFGLTAEIMQHAEIRVGVMMAISFLLLGISQKLKNHCDWRVLCGWLKSIAGAVILFATLGAGGIEGLQFIYTPIYALLFLCFGIAINIVLAMTTASQGTASLHVILSIIAFCLVPQAPILLPIGALVAGVGLMAAFRAKWDLHLLLIVIAFGIQNTVWTYSLSTALLPWMHYLAVGCSLVVGSIAASVHYSKKYHSSKLEVLPLTAHITNWGVLIWNIWMHAQLIKWMPLILAAIAAAGFVLARVAKKKNIDWLFYTDTLLSQLVAMATVASIGRFSPQPIDLGLMLLFETLVFNFVCGVRRENFLLRAGYLLQFISYIVIANFTLKALFATPVEDQFPIYFRMGIVAAISWGYHAIGSFKDFVTDDFRFVLSGKDKLGNPVSMMTLCGSIFFLGSYFFGINSLIVQTTALLMIGAIAVLRKYREDYSWNLTFIAVLAIVHIMNWNRLLTDFQSPLIPSVVSRIDFLGLLLLDILLIFGNFLQFTLWKKNIHHLAIYALGLHLGLLTYVFTSELSVLIPGLAFLGFSLIALEVSRKVPSWFKYSDEVKIKISEGMTHLGLAFLMAFVWRFVTIHLQIDPIWHGISLRWLTEALGLLTIAYWIAFYPREETFSKFTLFFAHRLIELCLGFITLCVLVEVPEEWRPLTWAGMAIGLLIGNAYDKLPKRLLVYSWMYLLASIVHVAFVTSTLTMPTLFFIEQHNIPASMAIALQLVYTLIAYRAKDRLINKEDESSEMGLLRFIPTLYRQPSLTVLLPVFLGVALLFAFNFEKAVLTFLWVGLTSLYLTVGLLVKSNRSIQIAMVALILCSIRLIIFDLVQSDPPTRALVFIGVGSLMLGVSVLYKKYKHRIERHEKT